MTRETADLPDLKNESDQIIKKCKLTRADSGGESVENRLKATNSRKF